MHDVATYCNCASGGVGISRSQNLVFSPIRVQIETNAWRKPGIGRTGCELLLPLLPQGRKGRGEEAVWNPSLPACAVVAGRRQAGGSLPARSSRGEREPGFDRQFVISLISIARWNGRRTNFFWQPFCRITVAF